MRLLRRDRNTRILTNYRQVAQAVAEKRKARLLSEPASVETPKPSETYRPRQRLQNVRVRVDELVDTSLSIPRTWDPDLPAPSIEPLRHVNLLIGIAAIVVTGSFICVGILKSDSDRLFVAAAVFYTVVTISTSIGLVSHSRQVEFTSPLSYWIARGMATLCFLAGLGMLTFALWHSHYASVQ